MRAQAFAAEVEIIVHDDASTNASAAHIRTHHPDVRLIESAENVGFCIANNRMAAAARGRYLLLLNNDATLLPDALETLRAEAERLARAGVVPYRFIHAQTHEPAIQQVVVDVVDQLSLGVDGEQGLDQAGAQKTFRRDRIAAGVGVQGIEFGIHAHQNRVHGRAQFAHRVRLWDALLQGPVTEQGGLGDVGSTHGLRRSGCVRAIFPRSSRSVARAGRFSTA